MLTKIVNANFSKSKQSAINVVASIINMLVISLISFFLSPYIVKNVGVEANGFVTLANNFITYALLARTALNSMGSRFLMMAYYNDEHEKVERYYSSLFYADLLLGIAFSVLGTVCVWQLEHFLNISADIVLDVKILFALLFLNFIISTIITVWSTAPYIKNKLYLDSISTAVNAIVRAVVTIGLFVFIIPLNIKPSISIVGIGTFVGGMVAFVLSFIYKKMLLPEIKAKRSNFSWGTVKELVSSGIWNSISSLGNILTHGLDLLVANLFVGPMHMGVLAVSKTMPSFISTLNDTIANVFTPSLIIDYAKEKVDGIVHTIKQSSKIISVICSLPLGFLLIYGKEFYALWQPTQEAQLLHILSVITIFGRVFFTGMQPLFNVFTVVNKVKINSIVTIITGVVSIVITYVLLKTTDLGIYAVAGVSVVCCFFKNVLFVIPYSAKYLGLKKTTFFSTLVPSVLCCVILCALGFVEKLVIAGDSWITLILAGIVFCVVGLMLTSLIVLNKNERSYLINIVKNKVRR